VPRGLHDFGIGISETGLLRGEIASADNIPSGCSFHTRCPLARDLCAQAEPPLETIEDGTSVACFAYPEWPD
jgi:oligopeptide/dipeptide ABC transporter ATP-binding protein